MAIITYHPIYQHPLPEGHRFPMLKYELIPKQLLYEGIIQPEQIHQPNACNEQTLLLTHTPKYIQEVSGGTLDPSHVRRIGFPWSIELYQREIIICQGTIDCALHAINHGVGLNVAGGTHHAYADKGEGFCLFNDIAVAANYLLHHAYAQRILIIDLDVHQGNGTAHIFKDNPNVYTFSMHGKDNYPFFKETSDRDVPLANGIGDEEYLNLLKTNLDEIFQQFSPNFVFYLSGVDILSTDKFGKLNISTIGCMQRDKMVFEYCKKYNLPVTVAMGGGYSPNIADIVNAHVNTFKLALDLLG
jgi:acetoin utilization deacetylase AcuC-like enzyme